ncbi:MAG: biotin--[acetyl-CoA-carboxylase] ligase [Phycisphaerales bacterium]|jgi:BirA family biotin operon repressor/biotin-[acetyl-CoA-carboxylase] ligase|nr:biotin--[acetyl-CoA-carboxylase] ligase [Phycisphaerales bacterium]
MSDMAPEILAEIADWPDRLEASCRGTRFDVGLIRVLSSCDSTQDVARMTGIGAVVTTGRQTAGRGRLGRVWIDDEGAGIAMSLTVPMQDSATISLASGIAVLEAIRAVVPPSIRPTIGLKFPNDVVESISGAKIAGILVEASEGVAVIGIGVNLHRRSWPPGIHARSIEELAPEATLRRIDLLEVLPSRLSEAIDLSPSDIADRFSEAHAPTGCRVEVESGDRRITGRLESLSPLKHLEVSDSDDVRHRMPAASSRILSWDPSSR